MKSKKRRYAAKTREYNIEEGMEGVGLGSRGKKWAGLVRLIAPELCRKNKLSCRRRAELGWAEQGTGSGRVRQARSAPAREEPMVSHQESWHIY